MRSRAHRSDVICVLTGSPHHSRFRLDRADAPWADPAKLMMSLTGSKNPAWGSPLSLLGDTGSLQSSSGWFTLTYTSKYNVYPRARPSEAPRISPALLRAFEPRERGCSLQNTVSVNTPRNSSCQF